MEDKTELKDTTFRAITKYYYHEKYDNLPPVVYLLHEKVFYGPFWDYELKLYNIPDYIKVVRAEDIDVLTDPTFSSKYNISRELYCEYKRTH